MNKDQFELSLWSTKEQEKKLAIIASDTMDSLASAYNINYTTKITGQKELTFSLHYRYIDFDGQEKDNIFFDYIINGATIKLRDGAPYQPIGETLLEQAEYMQTEDTDEKWYEFEVSEVKKNSEQNEATIIAQELYVHELSRNGWAIVLDPELENNYGTASELATSILQGSNWTVSPKSYNPTERISEPLLIAATSKDITVAPATWGGQKNTVIPANNYIYIFYSNVEIDEANTWQLKSDMIQILWAGNNKYFTRESLDDNLRIIDDDLIYNYEIAKEELSSAIGNIVVTGTQGDPFNLHLTGYRVGKQQSTHLCAANDQYVYDWKVVNQSESGAPEGITNVMSYIETNYSEVAAAKNLINNSTNFTSMIGWEGKYNGEEGLTDLDIEAAVFPDLRYDKDLDTLTEIAAGKRKRFNYLIMPWDKDNTFFFNKGPYVNKLELIKDEIYVIRSRCRWMTEGTKYSNVSILTSSLPKIRFDLWDYKTNELFGSAILTADNVYGADAADDEQGYPIPVGLTPEDRTKCDGSNLNITYHDEQGYYYLYFKATDTTVIEDHELYLRITTDYNGETYRLYMEDLQLFKYVEAGVSLSLADEIYVNTTVFPEDPIVSIVEDKEIFFYVDDNNEIKYLSGNKEYYEPIYPEGYASIRNLTLAKSNYFNNLQSLAELFQVWVKFKVYHTKSGGLLYDEAGNPRKEVIFSRYSPNGSVINYAGFKYGLNEQSIERISNSDEIATKVIVIDNDQEYATDGKCSITRAKSNLSGENVIYNFSYFIEKGLIDVTQLNRDLYGLEDEDIGLYSKMKQLNIIYDETAKQWEDIISMRDELDSRLQIEEAQVQSLEKQMENQRQELAALAAEIETPEDMDYYNHVVASYNVNAASYYDNFTKFTNDRILFDQYEDYIKEFSKQMDDIAAEKVKINADFYRKYYRFIREGTWTDNNYIDDELYYLDGLKIAETSAYPKVTYQINVVDLINAYDDYHEFDFKIGERTYVEDGEFFGYTTLNYNGTDYISPNRIEVIVSEYHRVLDNPIESTVVVQNYKNQFEELFQKITATTQSLQFAAGSYERAANAVLSDGSINGAAIQAGIANAALNLGKTQSFVWDTNSGILMTNTINPNQQIKMIGSGLYCSNDGGITWTTGITGDGINAESVNAGILNVDKVTISSNSTPFFNWTKDGLHAYRTDMGNSYVNYNQYGIYGTDHVDELEAEIDNATTFNEKLEAIKTFANFALTWDGLNINDSYGTSGMQMELSPGIFEIRKGDTKLFGIDAAKGSVVFGSSSTQGEGLAITEARLGDDWKINNAGFEVDGGAGNSPAFWYSSNSNNDVLCADAGGDTFFSVPAAMHINSGFNINEDGKGYFYNPLITDGEINGSLYPEAIQNEGGTKVAATADLGGNTVDKAFRYIYSQHALQTVSTRKSKENIAPINDYNIDQMNPVSYNLIGDDVTQLGFIAEEMYEICPEAVGLDEAGNPATVSYTSLVPICIREIQRLRQRVKELEEKL